MVLFHPVFHCHGFVSLSGPQDHLFRWFPNNFPSQRHRQRRSYYQALHRQLWEGPPEDLPGPTGQDSKDRQTATSPDSKINTSSTRPLASCVKSQRVRLPHVPPSLQTELQRAYYGSWWECVFGSWIVAAYLFHGAETREEKVLIKDGLTRADSEVVQNSKVGHELTFIRIDLCSADSW